MEEKIIIQNAIEQLERNTGIKAAWEEKGPKELDGRIHFKFNGQKYTIYIDVKKELRNYQLPQLQKLKEQHNPLMIVAENIFPKIKEELRKEGIGYLDTQGNIYFGQPNMLLWIDGQKQAIIPKQKAGRAFTKTGLKVVFHFLLREDWINLTYREIAHRTGVGFGNINVIMNDLKEQGFLLPLDKSTYKLANKKELLNKWMNAYEERLKPALLVGNFRFLKDDDFKHWQTIPLKNSKTWWGGEPAGEKLTNYLRPGVLTLYTTEKRNELIQHYRIVPDPKGNIQVYHKFWQYDEVNDDIVPPLLVYIDLMNTGDRRCIETAQKIYNAQLQNFF